MVLSSQRGSFGFFKVSTGLEGIKVDSSLCPTSLGVIKKMGFVYTTVIMYCEWGGQLKPSDPDLHMEQSVARY